MGLELGRVRKGFLVSIVAIALLWLLIAHYGERLCLLSSSYMWRARNHDMAHVNGYDLSVGRQWIVKEQGAALLLIDRTAGKRGASSMVSIFPDSTMTRSRQKMLDQLDAMPQANQLVVRRNQFTSSIGKDKITCTDYDMNLPKANNLALIECYAPLIWIQFYGSRSEVPTFSQWLRAVRKSQ